MLPQAKALWLLLSPRRPLLLLWCHAGEAGATAEAPWHDERCPCSCVCVVWAQAVLMQRLEAQTRVQLQLHLLSPGAAQSTPMAVVDVPRDKLDALRGGVSVVEALALRSPQAPGELGGQGGK